jgi:probable HAF family extracellular repeat protein
VADPNTHHSFLYQGGISIDLGGLSSFGSEATGINASGNVAGSSFTTGGATHAYLYSNGSMSDLGTLAGFNSFASGINAGGQIVGASDVIVQSDPDDPDTTFTYQHAFVYTNGVMTDIGTLDGFNSSATGINDSGAVTRNSSGRAFDDRNRVVDMWRSLGLTCLQVAPGDF